MRRLKVLHLITHLALGGATKNVLALCRLSDAARIESALLSGVTSVDEAILEGVADALGVIRHTLPSLRRPIRPLTDGRAYRDLIDWLKTHKPDVVHTHGSKAGILGRLAAAAAEVPVIVHTVHGWGHHDRQHAALRRIYIAFERRAARVTDRIIVVANASRSQGLVDGIGIREQYVTVRGGIDLTAHRKVRIDRADLRASLGIPPKAAVVGTVSRMAPQKAPDDFVRMAALIHAHRPQTHFVFVGGGPLQAAVEVQAHSAGLDGVIHLLGYRDDVASLLPIFDVFVLNSLWEGMPAVFAQAMCAELPIVATDVGGAAEVIVDGQNGFLVPAADPRAQSERVLTLLDHPARRGAMGRRGWDVAAAQFDEREMVRRIEEIYLECARAEHLLPASLSSPAPSDERSTAQEASIL